MSALLQYLVLAGLLLWSVLFVLRRLMPVPLRRMQVRLADGAARRDWHRMASWLQPGAMQKGCDNGCSSCGPACDEAEPDISVVQLRKPGLVPGKPRQD